MADGLPKGSYNIIPPRYIGSEVKIGENSEIGPETVLLDGCTVGENCKVRGPLLDNSQTGSNTKLLGALICDNAVVKSYSRIYENTVIGAKSVVGSKCGDRSGRFCLARQEYRGGFFRLPEI